MVPNGKICPFMTDPQRLVNCAIKCMFAFDRDGKADCLWRAKIEKELSLKGSKDLN